VHLLYAAVRIAVPVRVHTNIAAVALANKMARIAWAVLAKSEAYRPPLSLNSQALVCN
jgi:transposase